MESKSQCIFCLEEKEQNELTNEHIIYEALGGGNLVLKKSSCKVCQDKCNKSFETRLLKGSNFIALLRSHLGLRGKKNQPVYGFDKHGHPLTIVVQPGFPPIQIGIAFGKIERPMQVIIADENMSPLNYYLLPNLISRPISIGFFDNLIESIDDKSKFVALWVDGDFFSVNVWRELLEAFISWANFKLLRLGKPVLS